MKHEIKLKESVKEKQHLVIVELIPETPLDRAALINTTGSLIATEGEATRLTSYLNFSLGLGAYSIKKLLKREGNTFTMSVIINTG